MPDVTGRPDLQRHLERGLASAQRVSGLPVAFGGLVAPDDKSFTISGLRGAVTTSMLHLRVERGKGLGERLSR
jgi:LuxR family transcriptional regulator, regulator of acetate metabolism